MNNKVLLVVSLLLLIGQANAEGMPPPIKIGALNPFCENPDLKKQFNAEVKHCIAAANNCIADMSNPRAYAETYDELFNCVLNKLRIGADMNKTEMVN